jgi:primosomal protein N'
MTYLFSCDKFSWRDRIFLTELPKKYKLWDLLMIWTDYFINLWNEISFPESYNYKLKTQDDTNIIHKKFLYPNTIKLIHFLVYTYYTTYKNIIPLFINLDISKLLTRQKKTSKKIVYDNSNWNTKKNKIEFSWNLLDWQQLIVFPDLRTLTQSIDINSLWENISINSWKNTIKQKDELFRQIKTGKTTTLICTYSQIFKDWKNLQNITIIDNHKWYYKNQQDPRYETNNVLEKMSKIYECSLTIHWLRNILKMEE